MRPLTDGTELLVGREVELSRLAAWIRDVAAGRGRAVLVDGEPGVGKSALVRTSCAVAEDAGCQVFWGAGDDSAGHCRFSRSWTPWASRRRRGIRVAAPFPSCCGAVPSRARPPTSPPRPPSS
ncbi:ATP-binding protein [Amycolatopsis nalaikhensis]|uniref:ATP-binding protein n=1 Tax=Amycolatopsis nalaikhensis TaxID=715472 RepID=A0ABY8XKT1_9PSEU|nr:ATP-binding protein [Amycolatopsis sp. 2-2]WIV56224.1 ATP-binding protein [Amycolatopsis sp. 2-2]